MTSAQCQLADWKVHKKGCKIQQVLNQVDEKYNLTPLRPAVGRCTGCNLKFNDEDQFCEDACEECGYQVCESCCVDTSGGELSAYRLPVRYEHSEGTCYCPNKNFGNLYCDMPPRWYHSNGRGVSYNGDRHPEPGDEYPAEAYETVPRQCGNCDRSAHMLKKEFY